MGAVAARPSHHHSATRRTILSASPELQMLFRLIAAIGVDNVFAAEALCAAGWRFEAAVNLLQQWICGGCGWTTPMRLSPNDEGPLREFKRESATGHPICPRCKAGLDHRPMPPATLRQRIHRLPKRVRAVLGPEFDIRKTRRAAIAFGAEERGLYRTAAAPAGQDEETVGDE